MICRTVWHPATRPSCIVRPSVAAQRPSARANVATQGREKFRLTPCFSREDIQRVPLLVRSWTSCPEEASRSAGEASRAASRDRRQQGEEQDRKDSGRLLGALVMRGLLLRETPDCENSRYPSFDNPAVRPLQPDPWFCVPHLAVGLPGSGKGSLPLLLSRRGGNSCASADHGLAQRKKKPAKSGG